MEQVWAWRAALRFDAAIRCRDRDDWLRHRRIGSSDVAKLSGPEESRRDWSVWARLTGRLQSRSTSDTRRGHAFEPDVLRLYGEQTGYRVVVPTRDTLYLGPEDWGTSTPDGFADDGDEWGLVEAKTDRLASSKWGEPGIIERWSRGASARVRPDYALQVYHQMWALDAPWCDLAVLTPFYELLVYRLMRDLVVEAKMVRHLQAWWTRHIVGGLEIGRAHV